MTTTEKLFADLKKDGITINAETITKAKNGDGVSMFNIGYEYYNKKKYDKSMAWLQLATDKNHSEAQNRIGILYFNGFGVPVDYLLAMEWYLKAAIQNNENAWRNIGYLFENGYGVSVNKYKALEWYYKQGEDSFHAKRMKDQGIQLKSQDKNKSIEQLVKETEDIAWPEKKYIRENKLKEISTLKQLTAKLEEESRARNNEINSLKEENQTLKLTSECQQQEINTHIEFIDQYKQKEQTLNSEIQALKLENHAVKLKMEAKDNKVALLEKEINRLQIASENSSRGAIKRVEELEKSNQDLERMLEQERQLKDGQIELLKQKMELLSDTEKQKRNELERKYRAIKRELRNMKTPTQKRTLSKQASIKSEKDENNSTNGSDNETDQDTEYDSAGSDNNDINHDSDGNSNGDINYDNPSEEDDGDDSEDVGDGEKNENDLNYDSDEQSKNRKKIPSVQSTSGSKK